MNKNFLTIAVIALILIGGGMLYFSAKNSGTSSNATSTVQTTVSTTTSTTVLTQAAAPTAITSSNVSSLDTTAMVIGVITPNGAFTTFWYEYGLTANLGSKTTNQTIGSGFLGIPAPGYITNLTKNTTYYFKIVAENQYGRVAGSEYSFKTTGNNSLPPVGSAPTTKTLSASGISKTTANINGEVTPNKNITQYWFEYGKTAELGSTSALSLAGDGSVKIPVSISLSNLLPGTTYYFRLNALNQFGTINGSILNFKTDASSKK